MTDLVRGTLYDLESSGHLLVYPRCPQCQRYIKHGEIWVNGLDEVKLKNWLCHKHGEVTPDYEYVDPADLIEA